SILKMRESDYVPALREFSISTQGIDVAETFESAEAILSGQARPQEPRRQPARSKKPAPRTPTKKRRSRA
ncbi:MAG TPA: circadian clock protein KaiC, partial [Archangium sp.]